MANCCQTVRGNKTNKDQNDNKKQTNKQTKQKTKQQQQNGRSGWGLKKQITNYFLQWVVCQYSHPISVSSHPIPSLCTLNSLSVVTPPLHFVQWMSVCQQSSHPFTLYSDYDVHRVFERAVNWTRSPPEEKQWQANGCRWVWTCQRPVDCTGHLVTV